MIMNMDEISGKVKDLFSRGRQASKEALEKAGDKVQDFTDKSVTKIEIHKLETKRDCKYEEMGLKLSQMLLEGASITSSNPDDIRILNDIQEEIIGSLSRIVKKQVGERTDSTTSDAINKIVDGVTDMIRNEVNR